MQPYLLAVDDVMLTQVFCIQFALKQNSLILTALTDIIETIELLRMRIITVITRLLNGT